MKKIFLLGLIGILLIAGTANAETPANRILKAFDNFYSAKTYSVVLNNTQKTTMKFYNKKDQAQYDKDEKLKKIYNKISVNDYKVDNTDLNNKKSYATSKAIGGIMDGMELETIKVDGYVYEKGKFGDKEDLNWVRSTSSIGDVFQSLVYKNAGDSEKTNLLRFAVQNYAKKIKVVKASNAVVQGKDSEHYIIDLNTSLAKSVYRSFLKKKNTTKEFNKLIEPVVAQIKNIKFDVWIESGSDKLVQYNILMTTVAKDKKSIANVDVLSEMTYKTINEPVEIFAPKDFVDSSSSTINTNTK